MINELSENEILDYLMTSDFVEGLTEDEFKFLLIKFRYYFRKSNAAVNKQKEALDNIYMEIHDLRKTTHNEIQESKLQVEEIENKYNSLVNRKLTWKERLYGKIILQK